MYGRNDVLKKLKKIKNSCSAGCKSTSCDFFFQEKNLDQVIALHGLEQQVISGIRGELI